VQRVEILIYEGVDELDAIAPFEVLAAAGFQVELVAIDPAPIVRGAHGLALRPDRFLGRCPELLVVPGGGWLARAPRGAWAEARSGVMPAAIADRHAAGSVVAGVCTGAMLLAAGGLLTDRPAVTHRGAMRELLEAGAQVHPEARVVDDGDVLTSGGVSAAIDLALNLVRRGRGIDAARASAKRIEHRPQGPVVEVLH
jgi:transcriptional regulator GlxA family with amidase domain